MIFLVWPQGSRAENVCNPELQLRVILPRARHLSCMAVYPVTADIVGVIFAKVLDCAKLGSVKRSIPETSVTECSQDMADDLVA